MSSKFDEERRSFIHERIVPKKNAKKVIVTILITIGLAFLFGAVAGVTFYVSQRSLRKYNTPENVMPSLFVRDDTDWPTEEHATDDDIFAPASTGEPESGEGGTEEALTEESAEAPVTAASVYNMIRGGIVQVVLKEKEGDGLLVTDVVRRQETFAVAVTETEEYTYFMVDTTHVTKDASVEVVTGAAVYETPLFKRDALTGIGIIELPKALFRQPFTVVGLGNSSAILEDQRVFMIGTPFGSFVSKEEGKITFSGSEDGFWDGYRQRIYTNMHRIPGEAAALFSEEGKLIGWISDYSAEDSMMAVASGISPLKYLIEDLCLGTDTAYLGVYLRVVNWAEAAAGGIQKGIYVTKIEPGSPAYISGIQPGDRLQSIDGRTIVAARSVQNALDAIRAGDPIRVVVARRAGDTEEPVSLLVNTSARKP